MGPDSQACLSLPSLFSVAESGPVVIGALSLAQLLHETQTDAAVVFHIHAFHARGSTVGYIGAVTGPLTDRRKGTAGTGGGEADADGLQSRPSKGDGLLLRSMLVVTFKVAERPAPGMSNSIRKCMQAAYTP